jgi:hypothetical protein
LHTLPPERLLPGKQPIYVASWIYVFGVLTVAAFLIVFVFRWPARARRPAVVARVGGGPLQVNSLHLWSVAAWLWLYTFWSQVSPFTTSGNADALVWAVMALLSIALVCVPVIPGVRSIPRWIPVHRLIWRDYYRGSPGA